MYVNSRIHTSVCSPPLMPLAVCHAGGLSGRCAASHDSKAGRKPRQPPQQEGQSQQDEHPNFPMQRPLIDWKPGLCLELLVCTAPVYGIYFSVNHIKITSALICSNYWMGSSKLQTELLGCSLNLPPSLLPAIHLAMRTIPR